MHRFVWIQFAWAVALVILPARAWALDVVTTTTDLAAIAKEVGGADVNVDSLALHTQDPHWVDARPHLALKLSKADLLIVVGLDLEIGWLPTLQTGARNGDIQTGAQGYLDCSTLVNVLETATTKVSRAEGDIHPGGNPHYLYDPRAAERVGWGIAKRMAELDPEHSSAYKKRAEAFVARLRASRKGWEERLGKVRGQKLVAYHKSFSYLADWLGLAIVAHVEPKPGIPPNPGHVAHVISLAKSQGVRVLVQESWFPAKTSDLVAEKIGARVVTVPGGPDLSKGESYADFVEKIVKALEKGFAK